MMALRSLLCFCAVVSIVDGFVSTRPSGRAALVVAPSSLHMFNTDDTNKAPTPKPLPKAEPLQSIDEPLAEETESTNVVKDLNTGEVKEVQWIDPAMAANSNPLDLTWWAYVLFVFFPGTLLLNDVAKSMGSGFLPTDGPFGFLGGI